MDILHKKTMNQCSSALAAAVGDNGEDDNYERPTNLLFECCPFDFTDFRHHLRPLTFYLWGEHYAVPLPFYHTFSIT